MNYSILRNLCNVQQTGEMDIVITLLGDLENVEKRIGSMQVKTVNRLKPYVDDIIEELDYKRFNVEPDEDDEICNLLHGLGLIEEAL